MFQNIVGVKYRNGKYKKMGRLERSSYAERKTFQFYVESHTNYATRCLKHVHGQGNEQSIDTGINVVYFDDDPLGLKAAFITRSIAPKSTEESRALKHTTRQRMDELRTTYGYDTFFIYSPFKTNALKKFWDKLHCQYFYYFRRVMGNCTDILPLTSENTIH